MAPADAKRPKLLIRIQKPWPLPVHAADTAICARRGRKEATRTQRALHNPAEGGEEACEFGPSMALDSAGAIVLGSATVVSK